MVLPLLKNNLAYTEKDFSEQKRRKINSESFG